VAPVTATDRSQALVLRHRGFREYLLSQISYVSRSNFSPDRFKLQILTLYSLSPAYLFLGFINLLQYVNLAPMDAEAVACGS